MTTITDNQPETRFDRGLRFKDARLERLLELVDGGRRLDLEDGSLLMETDDIHGVCSLADRVRRRIHGDIAWYNVNRHLNYSNVCALSCSFCAFHRKKDEEGAYEHSLDEIRREAVEASAAGATEMHIVGGLHPWLKFDYYIDMLNTIRDQAPEIHVKAFTAVEIVHLARISGRGRDGVDGIRQVLVELRKAGLGSLPGGGAEVFDDRVHDEAFKGKIRSDQWLDVHRIAHELGLNTNATMLYGHVERPRERLGHLELLRTEQDRALLSWAEAQSIPVDDGKVVLTGVNDLYQKDRLPRVGADGLDGGYYQAIIPLPFFPDKSKLEYLHGPTGLENLRMLAVTRLMLDNFPHVKAFWIMQSIEMAEFMLQNGADDIDGTVVWYDITKLNDAGTHQEHSAHDLHRAIREAGFEPVERDTLYRRVYREGSSWSVRD